MVLIFLLNKSERSIPLKFAVSLMTNLVAFYVILKGSEWKNSMRRIYSIILHLHSILIIPSTMTNLKTLVQSAEEIAKIGGAHTLNYFKKEVEVISKADDSPVTIADRETEMVLEKKLKKVSGSWYYRRRVWK